MKYPTDLFPGTFEVIQTSKAADYLYPPGTVYTQFRYSLQDDLVRAYIGSFTVIPEDGTSLRPAPTCQFSLSGYISSGCQAFSNHVICRAGITPKFEYSDDF